jgi:hypothetical protein
MGDRKLDQIDVDAIAALESSIKRLHEIASSPKATTTEQKKCLKLIGKIQRDLESIRAGEPHIKTEFCEYCGEPYNPKWTILHGKNHLLLSTKRYDKKTGKPITRKH